MRQQQKEGEVEKAYLNFINSLRSKATINVYRLAINHYMRFINLDIKTGNFSSLLEQDTKTIEQQIISYLVHMRNQKLSYAILSMRLAALRKFYEMNDVVLNWKKVSNYLGENTKLFKDRAYTTEEIQLVLTKADERMRRCNSAIGIYRYESWCNPWFEVETFDKN